MPDPAIAATINDLCVAATRWNTQTPHLGVEDQLAAAADHARRLYDITTAENWPENGLAHDVKVGLEACATCVIVALRNLMREDQIVDEVHDRATRAADYGNTIHPTFGVVTLSWSMAFLVWGAESASKNLPGAVPTLLDALAGATVILWMGDAFLWPDAAPA